MSYSEQTYPRGIGLGQISGGSHTTKNVCTLSPSHDVYKKYFENEFLRDTEEYYSQEAQKNISSMTGLEYLYKAQHRFEEELGRLNVYLDLSTKKLLIEVFITAYITKHSKIITEMDGLYNLLDTEKVQNIKKIYVMFLNNESATSLFESAFSDYQKKNLNNISKQPYQEEKNVLTVIKDLINFHKKIIGILKCLQEVGHEKVKNLVFTVKEGFERHINVDKKVLFGLNVYLDYQYKEGFKHMKDSEIETDLTDVLDLFKYIHDKDVFEKSYKAFLSKRLLIGRSASEENEKLFVGKLQQECGSYFTSKIEIMFKDIVLSRMINTEFQSRYQSNLNTADWIKSFEIKVLTAGNWSFQNDKVCNLPKELKYWTKEFENFYVNKYPGRTLTWAFSQGLVELRTTLGGKKKEFLATTYQMCLLLLFNSTNSIQVQDIIAQTMIAKEEAYNHLQAFLSFKILVKSNTETELNDHDFVSINENFTHKSYRIKLPVKKAKEKGSEDEGKLLEVVSVERKYWIEACIVRIMKSRKKLDHSQLIEELFKLASSHQFKPQMPMIKTVIEDLISKEYMERSKENKSIYTYLS